MKSLILAGILFSVGSQAQTIVGKDSMTAQINVSQKVEVRFVETMDACIFTYDPEWAHEEDTRASLVVVENYVGTAKLEMALKRKGFTFYGYKGNDNCSLDNNTFPTVLTSEGKRYFSHFVKRSAMAKAAAEQNAFKRVTRIYVKGFTDFDKKVKSAVNKERTEILNLLR